MAPTLQYSLYRVEHLYIQSIFCIVSEKHPSTGAILHLSHSPSLLSHDNILTQTRCIITYLVCRPSPLLTELNGRRPSRRTQPSGSPSSVQTTFGWCGWLHNPANRSNKQAGVSLCRPDHWGLWCSNTSNVSFAKFVKQSIELNTSCIKVSH